MKKKYLIIIGAVALVALAAIGGTMASDYFQSEGKVAGTISEKSLEVSIVDEDGNTIDDADELASEIVPGAQIPFCREVANLNENGYDMYVKVSIYYDWSGDLSAASYENEYFTLYIDGEEIPSVADYADENGEYVTIGDWIVAEAEEGSVVLYYTKPLSYNETATFLSSIAFSKDMGNEYAGEELELEYEVNAVQANNSQDAIAAEWGVFPVFDDTDSTLIVGISETKAE